MSGIIAKSEIRLGEACSVVVDGVVVAVCNVDGVYYAVEGTCPHAGGPMGDGFVSGCNLVCPWHGWQFDVKSGACTFAPELTLERYTVIDRGDTLEICAPS